MPAPASSSPARSSANSTYSTYSPRPYSLRRGLGVLWLAVREEPRMFAAAVVGSALYGVMTVASARALGWVTGTVVLPAFRRGDVAAAGILLGVAAIMGVALAKTLGVIVRRICAGITQFRVQASYRRRVTRQYLRLPLSWHHRHPTGQLLSNANADVEAAWMPMSPLPLALGVLVMLAVASVAMLLTDVVLALVGFLIFPAIGVLNLLYQRRISPLATRAQQLRADVSGVAHESFDGALVVKTLGREDDETSRFRAEAEELRDANVAVGKVRGLFDPVLEALPNLGVLVVLLAGIVRIQQGAVGAGEVVQIAYLFTLLAFPVRALGWVLGDLPRSVVGWDRVAHVLSASGGLAYGEADVAGADPARIDASDLRFGYAADAGGTGSDGDDGEVLHGVDLTVEPGRTVAVVGPTGSGKSTLTSLLVRLVDPGGGQVRLDGVDLRDVRQGGLPGATAIVAQHAFLFDDDVRGNVTLGLDVGDEDVWAALRLAQADGFVAGLPDGLRTRVGERGTTLSGGQRQRLALARALVRRPRLLILDDATSSVDSQIETRILHGLREAGLPSTTVVVAYRMSTIGLADEVVYIEHGRVEARGTHDELLAKSMGYAALVTAYQRAEAERQLFVETEA